MSKWNENYVYINTQAGMRRFASENEASDWMCFDTEFVGEKRYLTQLCLIQVVTPAGNYLIDPFPLDDISPFLDMVENPDIVTITHAGDNDYRLLNQDYDLVPANVFDAQLAAGFAGYRYPISFRKLVESELGVHLNKGLTVVNWEQRPLSKRYLRYAIFDVLPLPDLWKSLVQKLKKYGRLSWAKDEFTHWEKASHYEKEPHREAIRSNLIKSLKTKEQVFLVRLFEWRRQKAEAKDYSKEMILPAKMMSQIVRSISSGREALLHNRRIPNKISERYGAEFERLFQQPISPEEKKLLKQIPSDHNTDPQEELILEFLYVLIKSKCLAQNLSPDLVLPRNILKRLKLNPDYIEDQLGSGWRRQFLGSEILHWLSNFDRLDIELAGDQIRLKIKK